MIKRTIPYAAILVTGSVLAAGCFGGGAPERSGPPSLPSELIVSRIDVMVRPLTQLNSPSDDFAATMPLDTNVILFTSARPGSVGRHSIYVARRTSEAEWTAPELAIEVNNAQSNGTPSIAPGAESMYFTGCDFGLGDCDLYRVEVGPRGGLERSVLPWMIPTNVGLPVNGPYWDSQVCLSADGRELYFSSDRTGGFGGKDIWSCHRNRDGTWSAPINAGEPVNTAFDEVTPWVSPDGHTLFFSSNGHPGVGGFDIFAVEEIAGVSVRSNLGVPANSPSDDIGFSMSADGTHTFIASKRGADRDYDLYRLEPAPVQVDPMMFVEGTVRDSRGTPVAATVTTTDLIAGETIGVFNTDPLTGRYRLVLRRGYEYAVTAQAMGHLFQSEGVTVPSDLERNQSRAINFDLQPIRGTTRLLVYFKSREAGLERQSMSDLDRAVLFLRANPDVRVEIAGHTDNEGSPEDNLALSQERAQAVKSYLVGNRVPADRIDVKGYGATQPVAGNDTEEGRASNRRVEMRILE